MLSIATAQHPGAGVAAASAAVVPTEVGVSGGGMSSVFRSRDRQKTPRRQPIWLKRDKFMRHGELLLSAALSAVISPAPASEPPGPAEAAGAASSGGPGGRGEDDTAGVAQALERCLAVVRFAVGMLADMLRPGGPDSDDLPVTALGQHHVTVRQLLAAARTQQQHPMATSGTGRTLPVPAPRVHVQELLSFDPAEGPKSLAVIEPAAVAGAGDGTSGLLLLERLAAVARVRIDPRVSAKAKRLGREVSLKQAPAAEQHRHPEPQQAQERYLISSLPSLVLRGRLPHAAEPEFKGDLVVHSPDTGMMASGGKAAEQLTHQLAGMLHSLFPGSRSSSRSGGAGGSSSAAAGPVAMARSAQGTRAGRSVAGAAGKESIVGASSSAAAASTAAAANPDDSDADSDFEAAAARDAGDTAEDPRDVPPNYKAKHAAGQRLGWQLQYTLVLPDASAAPAAANSATGAAGGTARPATSTQGIPFGKMIQWTPCTQQQPDVWSSSSS
eukprot:XP_001699702.1 predicted protein [Chlamydomonas reinhardtii]